MSMDWIASVAEQKIREAIQNGEFDRLPGAGKPLRLDDDSGVPEHLRAGYRLLKNAGMIPEELQLRKEMLTLEDLLACCRDEREKTKLRGELAVKKLRYQTLMAGRGWTATAAYWQYEPKIREKLLDAKPQHPHDRSAEAPNASAETGTETERHK